MATFLKNLISGIKRGIATIDERGLLTNGHQASPGTSRHPASRNGAGHNGHTNGTAATQLQGATALTKESYSERGAFWASQNLSRDAQMREWERLMEGFLAPYTSDPAHREQLVFLRRLLRQQQGGALNSVEVSARALYQTFFREGRGELEYFLQRITDRNTPDEIARNLPLIENLARIYGSESAKRAQNLLSALTEKQNHHEFSLGIGTDVRSGDVLFIPATALTQHIAVTGVSGAGKTTWLLHLINQIARQRQGFALIEPHGDATRRVIACLPEELLQKVVYLDFSDSRSCFGLNLYQCDAPYDATEVAKVASFVMHVFEKVWRVGTETPRLAQVLRNTTRVLIENPGMTFAEIPLLLWDENVREKLISRVKNTQTRLFFENYNRKSVRDREELIASTMNKVDAYLSEPLLANIVSQSQTTIDFRKIMDEGKIVLVNLSPQLEEMSRLIGSMLVGKLLMAAFSREDTPEKDRRPFYIFIDEFQRFCSSEFRTFIEEARKFHVSVITAHQSLTQLEEEHRTATTGAGTLICFRVLGDPDAKVFARSFDATPQPVVIGEEPQRAVVSDVITHLVRRGHNDPKVAAFSQRFLAALEHFLMAPTASVYAKEWHVSYNCFYGTLILYDKQVQEGRKLLNECLYRCMSEKNPDLYIPMLATYILACSQRDGREYVFSGHMKSQSTDLFGGPHILREFRESARKFGEPYFTQSAYAASYIADVAKYRKREKWMAEAVVSMLRELRCCMRALASSPIMIDTGQMVPKYQLRTYQDQQNQIANEISQLENYTAKVKTLSGEYVIKTSPPPPLLPEDKVQERIAAIKANNLSQGYTRDYREVLEEVAKRQERLRERVSDAPPPSSATGRPPRRLRQRPPPPAFP